MLIISSPNSNDRPQNAEISMLVMHYTDTPTAQEAIDILCDRKRKVSAHYVVDEQGNLYQLVAEEDRAWHAGVSAWQGYEGVNDISIGIEIVNPGHSHGYRAFPDAQIQAVTQLSQEILSRHAIPAHNVVAHSDIAPSRKQDPGHLFPWQALASQGIGFFPTASASATDVLISPDDEGDRVLQLQTQLIQYGYPLTATAQFDEELQHVITAFQRHFRPSLLNGNQWDADCQARLDDLLAQRA